MTMNDNAQAKAEKIVVSINNYSLEQTGMNTWNWKIECISNALREYGEQIINDLALGLREDELTSKIRSEARTEALEELERRVIPTRPEANMLGTLTYLRLQEEIRAILAKRKEN